MPGGLSAPIFPETMELEAPFRITTRTDLEESLTPYKASVVILISAYAQFEDDNPPKMSLKAKIAKFLMQLIQSKDVTCHQFVEKIVGMLDKVFIKEYLDGIQDSLEGEMIPELTDMFADGTISHAPGCYVKPDSPMGISLRKILLAYKRLEFAGLSKLRRNWVEYWSDLCFDDAMDESRPCDQSSNLDESFDPQLKEVFHSENLTSVQLMRKMRAMAPALLLRFIVKQVQLMQYHPTKAIDPLLLERVLSKLVKAHKKLPQLNYLRYMNAIRLRDFDIAQKSLRDYVEWAGLYLPHSNKQQAGEEDVWSPFMSKSYRYGALLDAKLCANFGYLDPASDAIHEALLKGQDSGDTVCINNALAELCNITSQTKCDALEQLFSLTLNMNDATTQKTEGGEDSYASRSRAHYAQLIMLLSSHKTNFNQLIQIGQVLPLMSPYTTASTNYSSTALLSTIYLHYGYADCCISVAQQLLVGLGKPESALFEPHCIAMSNIAYALVLKGNFDGAKNVLTVAERCFPAHSVPFAKHWRMCRLVIEVDEAILTRQSSHSVFQLIHKLANYDEYEAKIKQVEWHVQNQQTDEAHNLLNELNTAFGEHSKAQKIVYSQFRCNLQRCDLWLSCKEWSLAKEQALKCMHALHGTALVNMVASAKMRLARAMIGLKRVEEAIKILESIKEKIVTRCSRYEAANILYFLAYAKHTHLCATPKATGDTVMEQEAATQIEDLYTCAYQQYLKLGAVCDAKQSAKQLAFFYNSLAKTRERNKWAKICGQLDSEFHS